MAYLVVTSSQAVRDIEEAVFYQESLGTYPENIVKFKSKIVEVVRSLATSPKLGANLSARLAVATNVKYQVIDDYILFYEIDDQTVKVLRLLPAKSNWMNIMMKHI